MTTFGREAKTCAVCGDRVEVDVLTSSNVMGPSDLDGRPAEMLRSTMGTWVQECLGCGYCAGDVSEAPSHAGALVRSDHYQALRGVGLALVDRRKVQLCRHLAKLGVSVDDIGRQVAARRGCGQPPPPAPER